MPTRVLSFVGLWDLWKNRETSREANAVVARQAEASY
jgi:hypothetical protein